MSGTTMSTPSSSSSGNMRPASMTMMSSPKRRARQFMPNSPSPPRGMICSLSEAMNLQFRAVLLMMWRSKRPCMSFSLRENDAATVASVCTVRRTAQAQRFSALCLDGAEHTRGEREQRRDQLKGTVHHNAEQPEGKQHQPDERIQQERDDCGRPADEEKNAEEEQFDHLFASKGGTATHAIRFHASLFTSGYLRVRSIVLSFHRDT